MDYSITVGQTTLDFKINPADLKNDGTTQGMQDTRSLFGALLVQQFGQTIETEWNKIKSEMDQIFIALGMDD